MRNPIISRPGGVVSFDRKQFDEVCAELMRRVTDERRPDVLIGIRTGGLVVAESMARAAGGALPVLAVTCRRPSSRHSDPLGGDHRDDRAAVGTAGLQPLSPTALPLPVVSRCADGLIDSPCS